MKLCCDYHISSVFLGAFSNKISVFFRNSTGGLLVVDDGPAITTQAILPLRSHGTEEGLYIGGMPQVSANSGSRYNSGIIGCVADLVLNTDYHIQLITMSAVGRNVGHCTP